MASHALHPADVFAAVEVLQHFLLFRSPSAYLAEAAERAMDNLLSRVDENAFPLTQVSPEALAAKAVCNAKKTVRARWGYGGASQPWATTVPLTTEDAEDMDAEPESNCGDANSADGVSPVSASIPLLLPETVPDEAADVAFARVEHLHDCRVLLSQATTSQQAVLRHRLEDRDDEDIARELGMSAGNVACLASRGITRIRACLAAAA